jgi:hypothetical protein
VNPLKAYALEEIARCAKNEHLRTGLKLHFGSSDVDVANPEHLAKVQRVFRLANEHGMAIAAHPIDCGFESSLWGAASPHYHREVAP